MATSTQARAVDDPGIWPSLPLAEWKDTRDTLHMWMQIVGKTRLALAPKENHWWHVPLYVGARGGEESQVLREANSHEEISVGFWPGSSTVAEPAFYAYARPEPPGFAASAIRPAAAVYNRELADFILPYEAVRSAPSPDDAVLDFYQSAYEAAADLARWDRAALDRPRTDWT